MSDSLPLIPEKGGAVCADVRPVLREVFREYEYLPPLALRRATCAPAQDGDNDTQPTLSHWIEKYESDSKEVWQREGELKQEYAKRISREPLPNIYKLQPPSNKKTVIPTWKRERGIIERKDLIPSVIQNSSVEDTLWVKSILNRSSGDLTPMEVQGKKLISPVRLSSPRETSLQSYSIGQLRHRVVEPPAPRPPALLLPEHILCVPPQLDFVNFTVGHLHSRGLRLINVSKFEVRLSVRPPSSRELDVELCGTRGLSVTSGAAAELKINFRPRDVRVLRDVLLVRVSTGKLLCIPICCYMQPPFLDILVPAVSSSLLSCSAGDGYAETGVALSTDCLELGARLLGDVHCVPVRFYCEADHAAFFLLTEDAWLSFSLDVVTSRGSLVAAPFVVWPAWWQGGGAVRGCMWCRAECAGLHAAALRLVATTAVVRPLHLIADALHYRPEHITLEAHEKNYDICNEDDPACEYYVHLGTAFPCRSLSTTVQLVNHSPVVYSYYWSVRPWGECSCLVEEQEREAPPLGSDGETAEDRSDGFCVGAKEARYKDPPDPNKTTSANRLRVEPARGSIAPRSTCCVHVCAPDVGEELGVQRAVLMLILKNIPKESLPNDYDPMIVKTEVVDSDPMPGVKSWTREIHEIVCAELEVWWNVAPVRFVLDPPSLHLDYSRRITDVEVTVRATQLFGREGICCGWQVPAHVAAPAPLVLTPAHSCEADLHYHLPVLPNHYPETDVITLEAASSECVASSVVSRRCATRHVALRPARLWLGLVTPGSSMQATLQVFNDTYQHICWWANPFRWHGENPPSKACGHVTSATGGVAREPCSRCQERACTCDIIRPTRGALHQWEAMEIVYAVHAPKNDGCVATLIKAQRTSADVARVAGGAGSDARATLVAYRVLAPRLVLRVLPCRGDKRAGCEACALDEGLAGSSRGTATLRPRTALPLARRTCYRLRFTNLTPLPTAVTWDPPLEQDMLTVEFFPKEFDVGSYAQVTIQVVLEARRVCGRRLFLYRAQVKHAYKPLYLVIDAAISGLEIICEVPLGGEEKTETTVVMRRTQAEVYPWTAEKLMPRTFEEIFAEEDRKRVERADVCRCKSRLQYIPPAAPRPRPPPAHDDDYPPIEIVWEPAPLTRVCACHESPATSLPALTEAYCLQFHRLPLRTVRTRTLVVRNESVLSAAWSATFRNWPRLHTRTFNEDQWAGDVRAPGVCAQVIPRAGVLAPRAHLDLTVAVYADCWGLYHDQLALKIENLEAIVLDLWVEAVGPPLQFALSVSENDSPVLCWMSRADPARALRVKNVSRSQLTVHAYVLAEHEHPHHELPFRLYLRLVDVQPDTCPCLYESEEESQHDAYDLDVETGVELYLARDYGPQTDRYFTVSPESSSMSPGEWRAWRVHLLAPREELVAPREELVAPREELVAPREELAPPSVLLLRAVPRNNTGDGWVRFEPPPQVVRLRQLAREGRLRVSSSELRVRVCALDLPLDDVLRVRKRFRVQNVGNGPLAVYARTDEPWALVLEEQHAGCGSGCTCGARGDAARERDVPLRLMPRSSLEMCVEVLVSTVEASPAAPAPDLPPAPPAYPPRRDSTTMLHFYDQDNILKTLSLILELEYPVLSLEPATIDFGFVTDGDTRKSYYTVAHSSRAVSLEVWTEWVGGEGFRLHPRCITLRPATRERIYIQYTAKWCGAPVEGWCVVSVGPAREFAGARAWCRAAAGARASPARDLARRVGPRDHTDDTHLLPPLPPTKLCL